jgi:hypothetical protein
LNAATHQPHHFHPSPLFHRHRTRLVRTVTRSPLTTPSAFCTRLITFNCTAHFIPTHDLAFLKQIVNFNCSDVDGISQMRVCHIQTGSYPRVHRPSHFSSFLHLSWSEQDRPISRTSV